MVDGEDNDDDGAFQSDISIAYLCNILNYQLNIDKQIKLISYFSYFTQIWKKTFNNDASVACWFSVDDA